MPTDTLAIDRLIERAAKRVVSNHANDQCTVAVAKRFAWPINKLREVIKTGCLDLRLIRRLGLYRGAQQDGEQTEDEETANNPTRR